MATQITYDPGSVDTELFSTNNTQQQSTQVRSVVFKPDAITNSSTTKSNALTAKTDVRGGSRVQTYQYPINQENDHYVKFSINLSEESRLISRKQVSVVGNADKTDQNRLIIDAVTTNAAGGIATTALSAALGSTVAKYGAKGIAALFKTTGYAPDPVKLAAIGAGTAGTAATVGYTLSDEFGLLLDGTFNFTNKLKKLAAQIILYTPSTVRVQYGISYSAIDNNLLAILMQEKNYASVTNGLTSPSQYAEAFEKILQLTVGANTDLGSLLSKRAVNKRRDIKFEGVRNRSFVFEYIFAPRNEKEAKEVAGIIFMFKYFAHPELADGYMNFMYTYPAEFDIEYCMQSTSPMQANRNLNRISSCALVDINVDYAPNGAFVTLEQGEPCMCSMTLVFEEIETLHRDRIGEDY